MSMHEKTVILKRFQKARRKYLPVKYSYYEYRSASHPSDTTAWYELNIGDAYLFIDTDGTFGMAREKYHARTKGDYYANVGPDGFYYLRGSRTFSAKDNLIYRWWFVGEDAPPLQPIISAT